MNFLKNQNIEIIQSENWKVENNQISKQYEIKSNINISKYIINLENQPNGCKVTNLEGQEKNEFNSNEKFKISIPINSLSKSGEFKIKIKTQMENKPIFLGKAPNAELQDYALTAYTYEDVDSELMQKYDKNETKIIIEKQDAETQKVLKGAKFEILNQNKKVIRVAETNDKGQILIEQAMPGIYYIREIKAPEGYEADGELQKIEVKMNETKTIKVENREIVIEEPPIEEASKKEEPIIEEDPPIIEEGPEVEEILVVEIPKLPVTGM